LKTVASELVKYKLHQVAVQ